MHPLAPPENFSADTGTCGARRELLRRGACACLGAGLATIALPAARAQDGAGQRPTAGDRLVAADAEGPPRPLTVADLKPGHKPLLAFPYDPASRQLRDGSRFNKLLLVRLDPGRLEPEVQARAAEGVVAYSAVCTHQGCDVTEWVEGEQLLMCYCHFSRYDPARSAQVVAGPAPRKLPALPLAVEGGQLVVAGPFTSAPGAKPPA